VLGTWSSSGDWSGFVQCGESVGAHQRGSCLFKRTYLPTLQYLVLYCTSFYLLQVGTPLTPWWAGSAPSLRRASRRGWLACWKVGTYQISSGHILKRHKWDEIIVIKARQKEEKKEKTHEGLYCGCMRRRTSNGLNLRKAGIRYVNYLPARPTSPWYRL